MPSMTAPLPTHRCRVVDPDNAMLEVREFLEGLKANGERPWCEVVYPAPAHRNAEEWETLQADTFDAVELTADGDIVTLPPYAELEAASA
jgi:hypothetical protein